MVGLGGKEGWGFCKVSATRPVNFPRFFFFLPLSLLPSFSSKPSSPRSRLAVSLRPHPPYHFFFCVCLVSPSLSSLWVSRVGWRRAGGWASGPAMGRGGRGGAVGGPRVPRLRPPGGSACLVPPRDRARPRKASSVVCRRATCIAGEAAGGAGVGGGWEGKGKCRYILKTNNLDTVSSSRGRPLGAGSGEERE